MTFAQRRIDQDGTPRGNAAPIVARVAKDDMFDDVLLVDDGKGGWRVSRENDDIPGACPSGFDYQAP